MINEERLSGLFNLTFAARTTRVSGVQSRLADWALGSSKMKHLHDFGGLLRYLDRQHAFALLAIRVALGAIMVAHGYPKVFGGMNDEMQFVASLGIPAWMAYLSAYTELLGGSLVFLGLFTRAASVPICINLGVAIWKVHLHHALFDEGFELALAVFVLALALIFLGPGSIALDQIRADNIKP